MNDALLTFLVAVITTGYGTAVSWAEERFGKFHDLSPSMKQFVNAALTLILPYIVVFVQPYWRLEFGNLEEVITSIVWLIVPALIWLVSQAAHAVDPSTK